MEAEPPHGLALCPCTQDAAATVTQSLRSPRASTQAAAGAESWARGAEGRRAGPGSNSWRGVSTASRVVLRYLGPRSTGRRPPLWGGPPASLSPPTLPETPSQTPQNNVPPATWAPP